MRITLKTTSNTSIIPFNYQQKMIGTIHKWIGNNEIHDKISLYSFSWLHGGKLVKDKGFDFPEGAIFFISFYENKYLKILIDTILSDSEMFCGLEVKDITAVNDKVIKSAGVAGVIKPGKTSVQVIVGTKVQFVADAFSKLCE